MAIRELAELLFKRDSESSHLNSTRLKPQTMLRKQDSTAETTIGTHSVPTGTDVHPTYTDPVDTAVHTHTHGSCDVNASKSCVVNPNKACAESTSKPVGASSPMQPKTQRNISAAAQVSKPCIKACECTSKNAMTEPQSETSADTEEGKLQSCALPGASASCNRGASAGCNRGASASCNRGASAGCNRGGASAGCNRGGASAGCNRGGASAGSNRQLEHKTLAVVTQASDACSQTGALAHSVRKRHRKRKVSAAVETHQSCAAFGLRANDISALADDLSVLVLSPSSSSSAEGLRNTQAGTETRFESCQGSASHYSAHVQHVIKEEGSGLECDGGSNECDGPSSDEPALCDNELEMQQYSAASALCDDEPEMIQRFDADSEHVDYEEGLRQCSQNMQKNTRQTDQNYEICFKEDFDLEDMQLFARVRDQSVNISCESDARENTKFSVGSRDQRCEILDEKHDVEDMQDNVNDILHDSRNVLDSMNARDQAYEEEVDVEDQHMHAVSRVVRGNHTQEDFTAVSGELPSGECDDEPESSQPYEAMEYVMPLEHSGSAERLSEECYGERGCQPFLDRDESMAHDVLDSSDEDSRELCVSQAAAQSLPSSKFSIKPVGCRPERLALGVFLAHRRGLELRGMSQLEHIAQAQSGQNSQREKFGLMDTDQLKKHNAQSKRGKHSLLESQVGSDGLKPLVGSTLSRLDP
jgi:hypothetical protein